MRNIRRNIRYEFLNFKGSEYAEFKHQLNIGRHPGFIGRNTYFSYAINGGAFKMILKNEIIGVALINTKKNNLICLNITPKYRKSQYGIIFVDFLKCNFVRAIEPAKVFFEKCGYVAIGQPKQGVKYKIYIMIRKSLLTLFLKKG
jgi:hypothetical protein